MSKPPAMSENCGDNRGIDRRRISAYASTPPRKHGTNVSIASRHRPGIGSWARHASAAALPARMSASTPYTLLRATTKQSGSAKYICISIGSVHNTPSTSQCAVTF